MKEKEREKERKKEEKKLIFLSNYIDDKRRMTNKLEEMEKLLIASKFEREKNIFLQRISVIFFSPSLHVKEVKVKERDKKKFLKIMEKSGLILT